jgi:hypothetical protein
MSEELSFPTEPTKARQPGEEYVLWEHTLPVDPALHFSVAITRDWRVMVMPSRSPTEEVPLSTVAVLRRDAEPEAEVEVLTALIPREIDPADWLILHLTNHQYEILRMRRMPSPTGEAGDALSVVSLKSQNFAARSLAVKDGPRVFVMHCQAARQSYEAVAEEFLTMISTFRLLNPTCERFAEPVDVVRVEKPLECQFIFPASWVEVPDSSPPGGTSFSRINTRGDDWAGQFTFAAIPHELESSHEGFLSNYTGLLRENGVDVEAGELTTNTPQPPFRGVWSGALRAERNGDPLEIRCCIAEHANAWMLFAVIGPDWEADPEARAINHRAYSLALETFSVSPG